jgi:hypothetical protein
LDAAGKGTDLGALRRHGAKSFDESVDVEDLLSGFLLL